MKNNVCKKNIIHIHQLGFPINLEIIIPKDDSVRTLYEVTEGLDYSKLYEAYSTEGRNPMILPETLFRIVAYGYMEGIYSSRKLEKACKRDINFRWLLQGQKEPSHNTIARFRSKRLEGCVEDLFSQFIIELEKRNEIAAFNKSLGLPVCLADLGIDKSGIPTIVDKAVTLVEWNAIKDRVTKEMFAKAIADCDDYGMSLK